MMNNFVSSSSSSSAFLALKSIVIDLSEFSSEFFIWVGYGGESIPSYRLSLVDYIQLPVLHYVKDDFHYTEDESGVWNSLHLAFIQLFHDMFVNILRIKPKQCKIIIVENLFIPKIIRDCIFTVLTNQMNVSAIAFQPNLSLIPLSIGKSSGMIIFVSEKETQIIAFSHFHILLNSLKISRGYEICLQELKNLIFTDLTSFPTEETIFHILNDMLASSVSSKSLTPENISYAAVKHGVNESTMKVSTFSYNDLEDCLFSYYSGIGGDGKGGFFLLCVL
jgi:hypothetical protein